MVDGVLAVKNLKKEFINAIVCMISQYSRLADTIIDQSGDTIFYLLGEAMEVMNWDEENQTLTIPLDSVRHLFPPGTPQELTQGFEELVSQPDLQMFIRNGLLVVPVDTCKSMAPHSVQKLKTAIQIFLSAWRERY